MSSINNISLIIILVILPFIQISSGFVELKIAAQTEYPEQSIQAVQHVPGSRVKCPPGYIMDENGYCDPETTSNIPDNILMNKTENPDIGSINETLTSDSTEFVAILSGANGVPPVDSTASAKAHFELRNNASELTIPSFSVEGRNLLGIIAIHIHAGNNTENGPIVLILRNYDGSDIDAWEEQLITSGPIKPEDFEGLLRGKTIADLIDLINEGRAYVDIHTTYWSIPELRGTILPAITNTTSGVTELQSTGDLRELGYDDGCLDAENGAISPSPIHTDLDIKRGMMPVLGNQYFQPTSTLQHRC
jgi:hypothetical protein